MSDSPRVHLLERDTASPDAQKIYDALLATRGVVPNMFKVLAHRPEIAAGAAGFLKPLLSDSALPGFYKELIAVRVSQHHNSIYAVRAHSISARQKGATDQQIDGVTNFETGPYSEKEKNRLPPRRSLASRSGFGRRRIFSPLSLPHFPNPSVSNCFSLPLLLKCFRASSTACAFP
jgi:AhpD family alkylhydroperoxidase